MPSENLDEMVAELKAAQAVINPEIEGLEDFARLNILPEAKIEIDAAIVSFKKRKSRIDAAHKALLDLTADGYPDRPNKEVSKGIYDSLAEQRATIEAALKRFYPPEPAVTVSITAGTPQPK